MHINAYLNFDGQCEAAFKFYEQVLGGKIIAMMPYEGTPAADHMPAGMRNKVIHARIQVGDTVLMGSDSPPERTSRPAGFALSVQLDTAAEAERVFGALSAGGRVDVPMGQTFFAVRFGMFKDRFGVPWMVICEKEQ